MSNPSDQTPSPLSIKSPDAQVGNRRSFFAITAAVVTGSIAVLTPVGVGIAAFLTPLFRKSKSPEVRIALLDQVPDDGMPPGPGFTTTELTTLTRPARSRPAWMLS